MNQPIPAPTSRSCPPVLGRLALIVIALAVCACSRNTTILRKDGDSVVELSGEIKGSDAKSVTFDTNTNWGSYTAAGKRQHKPKLVKIPRSQIIRAEHPGSGHKSWGYAALAFAAFKGWATWWFIKEGKTLGLIATVPVGLSFLGAGIYGVVKGHGLERYSRRAIEGPGGSAVLVFPLAAPTPAGVAPGFGMMLRF